MNFFLEVVGEHSSDAEGESWDLLEFLEKKM